MKNQNCPRHNQHWASLTVQDRCKSSTLCRDSKNGWIHSAKVESMVSRFFQLSAAAHAIRRELVVQEAWAWHPIPLGVNLFPWQAKPSQATPWVDLKLNLPLDPDIAPSETEKSHWTKVACEGPYGNHGDMVLLLLANDGLQFRSWTSDKERPFPSPIHCICCQGLTQESQPFSKPMALKIGHSQAPIVRTLIADLFTDHQLLPPHSNMKKDCCSAGLEVLRQVKYRQIVKEQGEDVDGAHLCPAL